MGTEHKIDRDESGNFWTGSVWAGPFHVFECDIEDTNKGPTIKKCASWCPVLIVAEEKAAKGDAEAAAVLESTRAAREVEEVEFKRAHDEREAAFELEVNHRIALRMAHMPGPEPIPAPQPPPPLPVEIEAPPATNEEK